MRALVAERYGVGPDGAWLLGSRCERCGGHAFPARVVCPRCRERSMTSVRFGQRGTLHSFTVCHVAPAGWRAPYLQGYVSLPEGIHVFSLISDSVEPQTQALREGMEMELVVEPVRPGEDVMTFKYRPVQPDA